MLSTDELDAMRSTLEASLPDTAEVKRRTLTSDGAGGFTEGWQDRGTAVACRVAPTGWVPEERVIAERMAAKSTWTITLPALTDVGPADRLLVGSRVFEVAGVLARSGEISRRCVCSEVA